MRPFLPQQIQTDFSCLAPGDWFCPVTLKGVNQHEFIQEALGKGISGFICERGQAIPQTDVCPHVVVDHLREFLFSLAAEKRASRFVRIGIITGSVGKTTVTSLMGAILHQWLGEFGYVSPGNQNTKIALATQMLRLRTDCLQALFEVGARRMGDLAIPLQITHPLIVTLLNLGSAHAGEFGSKEKLVAEKLSVLDAPSAHTVVIYADDLRILQKAEQVGRRIYSFGTGTKPPSADLHVRLVSDMDDVVVLDIAGQTTRFVCGFRAPSRGINVAAAVALSLSLDVLIGEIQIALQKFQGVPRRFEALMWGQTRAIDDAFNASPESMIAGLRYLHEIAGSQKILLVLGSMLELGALTEEEHQKIAQEILTLFREQFQTRRLAVATIGAEAETIAIELERNGVAKHDLRVFSDVDAARDSLQAWKNDFDLVYLKGSKSFHLEQLLGAR